MVIRIFFFLLLTVEANAQVNSGARFTALGNSGTALSDVYSLLSNPSGIAKLSSSSLALSFENHFIGTDVKTQAALAVFPTEFAVFGAYFHTYGIQDVYNDLTSGVSLARLFGPDFAMGVTINYHQLKIANYGANKLFSVDLGIQYYFTKKWTMGAHLKNPGNTANGNELYKRTETQISFGNSYWFSNEILVSMDAKYIFEQGFDGSLGMEYLVMDSLKLRGGVSFHHFQHYVGFGFGYKDFVFDMATVFHARLGISPQIGLQYVF